MVTNNSHLQAVVNQDGAAVLDTRLGLITTLNPTGGFVWQRLQEGEDLETIVASLCRETGEQPEIVERDVKAFVKILRSKHLWSC